MKHLLIAIALMATTITRAQITLEKNYPLHSQLTVVKIEGEGEKYLGAHAPSKTVTLYNSDHSVYRSFKPNPMLFTPFTMVASYASKYLFDADAGIEVLVAVIDTTAQGVVYNLMLCNEDGSIKQYFPLSFGAQVVHVDGAWKLITTQPAQTPPSTEVWSLPGQYTNIVKQGNGGGHVEAYARMYPNPMSSFSLLNYHLPENAGSGVATIRNMAGQVVLSYAVQGSGAIRIDRGNLPAGNYLWTVSGEGCTSQSGKLVIQ